MNHTIRFIPMTAIICVSLLLPLSARSENSLPQGTAHQAEDTPAAAAVRALEYRIEEAMVSGDTAFLEKVFADDFTYALATGVVQNKAQWLQRVAKRPFVVRKIVSLNIEIHGDVAVLHGQLDLTVHDDNSEHRNLLKYLRVYRQKNGQWQMLTHRTLEETAQPAA
jgi:ketosteroid isomerase-like protein